MPMPLLTGRTQPSSPFRVGPPLMVAVVLIALLVAGLAWSAISTTGHVNAPATAAVETTPRASDPVAGVQSDARTLQLAHAEQRLVTAAEQVTLSRKLLASLSPQLTRSYLQNEKRRADAAWTACEAAQRAIEEALDDIRLANKKD